MDRTAALVQDVRTLLDHVGDSGVALTGTGRLRIADVRAINAGFAEPEELDHHFGARTFALRSEDEAPRVHFLRLAAQAAGLIDARRGRLRRTARARRFGADGESDARALFVAWWWKGAWDLLVPPGALHYLVLRDRAATARALLAIGSEIRPLETFGRSLRRALALDSPAGTSPLFDDQAWAYAAWHLCLWPLEMLGGARETREIEDVNGHQFEHLAAVGLTDAGADLLRAALEARPAAPPRVRRGMRSSFPLPRDVRVEAEAVASAVEDDRRERILREHPEYREAIDRGIERVGATNPRAHLALHEGIEEQLALREPPQVRETYERLVALGYDRHGVIHGLAHELAQEVWAARRDHRAFDSTAFVSRLAALPGEDDLGATPDIELVPLPAARLAATERRKLLALPRSPAVWEGDLSELPIEVSRMGEALCAMWVELPLGTIRALKPGLDAAPGALVLAGFVEAALRPRDAVPALPARVRVHPEIATALRPALADLGVGVEEAEELETAHDALASLAAFLVDPDGGKTRRRPRPRGR